MAKSIRQIKYGDFSPSKILFGDGTESKRVYAGDVMVWNKDSYAFSIEPIVLNAEPIEKTYDILVKSTNDDGTTLVPYTATTTEDWITIHDNGNKIVVNADDEPREGATESLRVYGEVYVSNAGGNVNLPEIKCIWKNISKRSGEINYKQGEDSELSAKLTVAQKVGSGEGTYHIQSQSSWLHVDENNNVTADQYFSTTLSREGTLIVISDLTEEVESLTVHQANILEQKKEYGIFSTLTNNTLSFTCTQTSGEAKLVIRYRYYQINAETGERIPASETSWLDTDYVSWTVNTNPNFTGSDNTQIVTTLTNAHNLNTKNGSLTYTLQPNGTTIPADEISSSNTIELNLRQDNDYFINNGEVFSEYRINGGSIPEINAIGDTVTASINSQYRRYKIWNSDKAIEYFDGETWLNDIGASFVSQSISGFSFTYYTTNVSSTPNTSSATYREGVGRFISNRVMDGQPLYIDLTVKQKYREKTEEYRFINPELTVNGKSVETWSPNAADQSKTFNIVSKVLRQYKWTDGNWYDNVDNTKENWDYSSNSIEWCTASDSLSARTTTLHVTPNSSSTVRDFSVTIKQKEDSHFANALSVTINVSQASISPIIPIVPPGDDPFIPEEGKTRIKDCKISVTPATYSPNAANQAKDDFAVSSTAVVEYLYTDGNWYAETSRYKIGYTATSNDTTWCTTSAQPTSNKATVNVTSNNNSETRNATVTLEQDYAAYDSAVKKTANIAISQLGKTKVEPEQIQWKNCSITASLPSYDFGYESATATFTVVSTADRWSLYTDGQYYQTSTAETMPYTSSPVSGGIRTNGKANLTIEPYTSADPRTQDIVFTQVDANGVATGATDTKTITQTGDAPIIPEEWENRDYVLTVTPSVWNIDAAAHTSSDFTYVSKADKYQKWISGWKKMSTTDIDVEIEAASATGRIKITAATNGTIALSAEAWDDTTNPDTKTLKIIQKESAKEGSIIVTQSVADIKQPEQSKFREDGYSFTLSPSSLNWLQTETDAKTVTATSYGYKVYLYTDGVWRGKNNKNETGDKVDFTNVDVSTSTHWNVTGSGLSRSFSPKGNADKDYNETITFTQLNNEGVSTGKTQTVALTHKYARKVEPEVTQRKNYSIAFTNPTDSTLVIDTPNATTTPISVVSTCEVWCKYDDGNYYYDRIENVDYTLSPSSKQSGSSYCYADASNVYTSNKYKEEALSVLVKATQNTGEGLSDSIQVSVKEDTKSTTKYDYKIDSVTIPNITYQGTAVTATVDSKVRSYKTWGSDGTRVDESSWGPDTDVTITSAFASGNNAITTNGSTSISASENTGDSERKAYFNFSNSHGATKNGVEAIQVTNTYTKYKLEVTPTSKTFTTASNGNVTLSITCQYCVCIGGTEGTWKDCDYTYEVTDDATYNKSTKIASLPSNVHQTTALNGTVKITAADMSATTGYSGTCPTVTVTLYGCADEILNSSEYKIVSASIPTIDVSGSDVTATVNCQEQDFKYWKSGGKTDVQAITKSWYAITTPNSVTSTRTSGSSEIEGNGLKISASSNSGSVTSNTLYQLTVSGGKADIAYNSASNADMTVTQEYKTGYGRNSTTERNAVFTFEVTFADNTTQSISNISVAQSADAGESISYPSEWSRDTTKNHTVASSGTNFVTLGTPTASNGVWTYNGTWASNAGESFSGTDYRVRLNPTSLLFDYNETSKTITAIHEKMDIVGGRKSSAARTNTFTVSYNSQTGSASYTQAGDEGSAGSGTGTWLTDADASLTNVIGSEGFRVSNSGNIITVTTSTNPATKVSEEEYSREVTKTEYSNYSLTISDASSNIAAIGGSSTHTVTATRTQTDTITITKEVIYNASSKKNGSIILETTRSKSNSAQLEQNGQTRENEYPTSTTTNVKENQSYTPSLSWVSGYPSGSGIATSTAPSITASANNNKVKVSDGYNYKLDIGSVNAFEYGGGTQTPTLTYTYAESYHYDDGSSRTLTGKCYDSVGNVQSNTFTAVQNGQTGDSTVITDSYVTDTSSSSTLTVNGTGFSNSGTSIVASNNTNINYQTIYDMAIYPDEIDLMVDFDGEDDLYEHEDIDVNVYEATLTIIKPTSPRTGTATYTHSKSVGGNVRSVKVSPESISLSQYGDERDRTEQSSWISSSVGYSASSNSTSVAKVSGNRITSVGVGDTYVRFTCNADSDTFQDVVVYVEALPVKYTVYYETNTRIQLGSKIYDGVCGQVIKNVPIPTFTGWKYVHSDNLPLTLINSNKWVENSCTLIYVEDKGTLTICHKDDLSGDWMEETEEDIQIGTTITVEDYKMSIVGYTYSSSEPTTYTITDSGNVVTCWYHPNTYGWKINFSGVEHIPITGEGLYGRSIDPLDYVIDIPGYSLEESGDIIEITENSSQNVSWLEYEPNNYNITLKYQDTNGNKIADDDKTNYACDEEVSIDWHTKDIDGYTILRTIPDSDFTMPPYDTTITYIYQLDYYDDIITVHHYLEKPTTEKTETQVYSDTDKSGYYGEVITVSSLKVSPTGYDYIECSPTSVTIDGTSKEVTCYYCPKTYSNITIHHYLMKDDGTKTTQKVHADTTRSGCYGYTVSCQEVITDYTYVSSVPSTVVVSNVSQEVSCYYKYTPRYAQCTIHHYFKNTVGPQLVEDTTFQANVGTTITVSSYIRSDISGYKLYTVSRTTFTVSSSSSDNTAIVYYDYDDIECSIVHINAMNGQTIKYETFTAPYMSTVTVSDHDDPPTGFKVTKRSTTSFKVSATASQNTASIEYGVASYKLTVHYEDYYDNELKSPQEINIAYGTTVSGTSLVTTIDGYTFVASDPETVTIKANNYNEIYLYYRISDYYYFESDSIKTPWQGSSGNYAKLFSYKVLSSGGYEFIPITKVEILNSGNFIQAVSFTTEQRGKDTKPFSYIYFVTYTNYNEYERTGNIRVYNQNGKTIDLSITQAKNGEIILTDFDYIVINYEWYDTNDNKSPDLDTTLYFDTAAIGSPLYQLQVGINKPATENGVTYAELAFNQIRSSRTDKKAVETQVIYLKDMQEAGILQRIKEAGVYTLEIPFYGWFYGVNNALQCPIENWAVKINVQTYLGGTMYKDTENKIMYNVDGKLRTEEEIGTFYPLSFQNTIARTSLKLEYASWFGTIYYDLRTRDAFVDVNGELMNKPTTTVGLWLTCKDEAGNTLQTDTTTYSGPLGASILTSSLSPDISGYSRKTTNPELIESLGTGGTKTPTAVNITYTYKLDT